jgi:hypothetical protein
MPDPTPELPEVEEFNYDPDREYVMVPPSQVTKYKLEGYVPVARNVTNHDGVMLVMERTK